MQIEEKTVPEVSAKPPGRPPKGPDLRLYIDGVVKKSTSIGHFTAAISPNLGRRRDLHKLQE